MVGCLSEIYQNYLACLNTQDWARLGDYVDADVTHNEKLLGLAGYHDMLIKDFEAIPDLCFNAVSIVSEGIILAARLRFDCHPNGEFLGIPVNGRHVIFHENAFYEFRDGKIMRVRSIIDRGAVREQLGA